MNSTPDRSTPFTAEAAAARAAQAPWAARTVRERLAPVGRLRLLLARRVDQLCAAVECDVGRPPAEVLASDVLPTADACRFLQRNAARILRPEHVRNADRPLWLMGSRDTVHRRPRGVVGVLGTWNYPVFLNAVQIVQALTAGNAVLWKPSELGAASARVVSELFAEAGYPPGLLQLLPAEREAGPRLVESDIDHLVFTGSAAVGRKLAARLGERLIPSTLELSGCDAMLVLADADVSLAARAAWFGATLNRGQTCVATRRVFVERPAYAGFVERLRPLASGQSPARLALESQAKQAERLVADALSRGAKLADAGVSPHAEGAMFPAVALLEATADMAVCREAAFAPLVAIVPCASAAAALAAQRDCPYGLGASVFTRDARRAERLAAELPAGMVTVNDALVAAAHPATPFGGRRDSGWGVTQGAEGLREMTVPQAVQVRSGTFRPHFDAVDAATADALRGALRYGHGGEWAAGLWQMLRGVVASARRK